jgi:hypothetical protein
MSDEDEVRQLAGAVNDAVVAAGRWLAEVEDLPHEVEHASALISAAAEASWALLEALEDA